MPTRNATNVLADKIELTNSLGSDLLLDKQCHNLSFCAKIFIEVKFRFRSLSVDEFDEEKIICRFCQFAKLQMNVSPKSFSKYSSLLYSML